jgi:hypothetical protein
MEELIMFEKVFGYSKEKKFWKWFVEHPEELFNFEDNQERVFSQLGTQLKKIDENLTFEFGPIQDNKREFILSADGIFSSFPAVQKLVGVAPKINRWTVIPFRQPKGLMKSIKFNDFVLMREDVWIKPEKDGDRIGLIIYVRNLSEENAIEAKQAAFIMLDSALGEYNVETMIGFIEFIPLTGSPESLGLLEFEKINDVFQLNFQ